MSKLVPVLSILLLFLTSCSKEEGGKKDAKRTDPAYRIFEKAKEEPELKEKLDLLSRAAKKLKTPKDSLLFDILEYQVYYHNIQKTYDSSLIYADRMISNAQKIQDTGALAKGYFRKASTYLHLKKNEEVLENMYKAQNYFRITGDSIWTGRTLVNLANAQNRLGDFTGSHLSATEALEFLAGTDSTYLASAYNAIALTSAELEDFEGAIDANNSSLKYARTLRDSLTIFNNTALHYRQLGNLDKAIEVLENILPRANARPELSIQYLRLANNYYFTRFLQTGEDVVPALEEIKEKRRSLGDLQGVLGSLEYLTSIYKERDTAKAREAAEEYLIAAKAFGNPEEEKEALRLLTVLENSEEQDTYALEFFRINDSIIEARMKIKNVFAKIRYDEEQKLKQIENLKRISAERRLEYIEERSEKSLILGILVLLLLVTFFVYYLIKEKHKKEKIKEVYSTEARISKKVHDELANDLFQIMTALGDDAAGVANRLENVYQRTRDISKENSFIDTGTEFPGELRGMIHGTVPTHAKIVLNGFEKIDWTHYGKEQKIVIYRTIQELLVNFRKHSQANFLVLKFDEEGSRLKITYKDNGVGTDLGKKHFSGLRNMENRIDAIGGSINFRSEIQKGFLSTIYIPT